MRRPPAVRHAARRALVAVHRQPRRILREAEISRPIRTRRLPTTARHKAHPRRSKLELLAAQIRRHIVRPRIRQHTRPRHEKISLVIKHRLAVCTFEPLVCAYHLTAHHRKPRRIGIFVPIHAAPHVAPHQRSLHIVPQIAIVVYPHRRPLRARLAVPFARDHEIGQIRIGIVAVKMAVPNRHLRETVAVERRYRLRRKIDLAHVELLVGRIFQIGIAALDQHAPLEDSSIRQIELQDMRVRPAVRFELIDVKIAVRDRADPAPFADLNRVIEQIAFIDPQIVKIIVNIQAIDGNALDMHILHAIHRRRAPIPLHADIMQTQIQAIRRANHIARRAVLAALFFARCVASHDIADLDIVRAPDINHRILKARIVHLVCIRHDVEAADMRIVALAPEHRSVLVRRRLEPHIATLEKIMRRRQHRITAPKMRIHRLRRRLMPVIRRHHRIDLQAARIIPVVRDRRRQKPVRRMQKQLIARLRIKIAAIIAHRVRIFLQEKQCILLQRRLITVDIHDEIIPHPCIRRLFRRLERKIIRFIISPEIKAEPRRIIVLDQKLRTRQINIAAALDRFIVVLSDNALMICHRHRIPLAPRQRLDRIRLRLIAVTHPKRLLIVRRTVQDRAELPIIHRLICNHRIKMLLLDRLAVSFIDRDRLSLCVLLQHIRALLIHLRRAVALIDQRILRLTRRTEVDRPRIGCCRP